MYNARHWNQPETEELPPPPPSASQAAPVSNTHTHTEYRLLCTPASSVFCVQHFYHCYVNTYPYSESCVCISHSLLFFLCVFWHVFLSLKTVYNVCWIHSIECVHSLTSPTSSLRPLLVAVKSRTCTRETRVCSRLRPCHQKLPNQSLCPLSLTRTSSLH